MKEAKKKKGKKALTENELDENISVNIGETPTITFLYMYDWLYIKKLCRFSFDFIFRPSSIVSQESSVHAQCHKMNIKYDEVNIYFILR